jgi:tetratricopeptide (TPR) repeat protein
MTARTAVLRTLLICSVAAAAAGSLAAAEKVEPLPTGAWLVDLARDYALNQRGRQTPSDVEHIRALLEAAVRVDPKLVDAHIWLYEIAALENDTARAARALAAVLEADPTHERAFALWLAAGLQAQQTSEQRVAWLQAVAAAGRPAAQRAQVCVALARQAIERFDLPEARRQLTQALALEPGDLDAATLLLHSLEPNAPAAERLGAVLRVLQLNPLDEELTWQAALLLDEYGFADEAARLFEHCVAVHQAAQPGQTLPGAFLLSWARNLEARGQLDAAAERAREAIAADPLVASEAGLFLYHVLECKEPGLGLAVRQELAQRFAAVREPDQYPVNEVAQAAWFYCTIEPQPDRALMLAQAAATRAPGDAFVQRVLGCAHAVNGHTDEALGLLAPLAGHDALAASMLAKLLLERGDVAQARAVLLKLEPWPSAGPAARLLRRLQETWPTSQPASRPDSAPASAPGRAAAAGEPIDFPAATQSPRERYPEIAAALAGFDARALELLRHPEQFLEARVTLPVRSFSVGEPWWAVFSVTNRSSLPIPLGPDGPVNPVFVLSFSVEGDQKRELPALMSVTLDAVRVLRPGQTVSVRRTLDVGPLRRVARYTPQQAQRITLRAIFDAVRGEDGQWRPAPAGQTLPAVYVARLPASVGEPALAALLNAASGSDPSAVVAACDVLAQLVGERQRADVRQLSYRPEPVPASALLTTLAGLLDSPSWETRARVLDALQLTGLDRRLIAKAQENLAHPHWLVRLMAVRLLARQGPTFAPRAEILAREDPDELVRLLADSFLKKWAE